MTRELQEEIGCDARLHDLDTRYVYDDTVEARAFLVEVPQGWEPTLNAEHDEYRWCSAAEAAAIFHRPETRELARTL